MMMMIENNHDDNSQNMIADGLYGGWFVGCLTSQQHASVSQGQSGMEESSV